LSASSEQSAQTIKIQKKSKKKKKMPLCGKKEGGRLCHQKKEFLLHFWLFSVCIYSFFIHFWLDFAIKNPLFGAF